MSLYLAAGFGWIGKVAEVGISLPVDLAAGLGGSRGCFGNLAGVFTNKGTIHLLNGFG